MPSFRKTPHRVGEKTAAIGPPFSFAISPGKARRDGDLIPPQSLGPLLIGFQHGGVVLMGFLGGSKSGYIFPLLALILLNPRFAGPLGCSTFVPTGGALRLESAGICLHFLVFLPLCRDRALGPGVLRLLSIQSGVQPLGFLPLGLLGENAARSSRQQRHCRQYDKTGHLCLHLW